MPDKKDAIAHKILGAVKSLRSINIATEQKQKTPVRSAESLLTDELHAQTEKFAYLLDTTYMFLHDPEKLWREYSPEKLADEWLYALDSGDTPLLLKAFTSCLRRKGRTSGALELWMEKFIFENGFTRADAGLSLLVVTADSGRLYENGGRFSDGAGARIVKHPWLRNGELAAPGLLDEDDAGGEKHE